jgi:hypothetical protein
MIPFGLDQEKISKLRRFLEPNEKTLWIGAPKASAVFNRKDLILVPVSLLWTAVFLGVFFFADSSERPGDSAFPPFFAIPFSLIAAYGLIGRFVFKWWLNKRTVYAVTDRNVLVMTQLPFSSKLRTKGIDNLGEVQQDISSNGSGSLIFGGESRKANWLANTGLNPFQEANDLPLAFLGITDARSVHSLIVRQRDEISRQRAREASW